ISALPPTAGQAFIYKLDTNTGLPVREDLLGPVSLRTTATVEAHTLLLRAATSYFALDDSFGPVDYRYTTLNPVAGGGQTAVARTGTTLGARVAATQFTLSYGVARRIEVDVSIPVVVVDARGGQVLSLDPSATLGNLGIGFGDNPRDLEK